MSVIEVYQCDECYVFVHQGPDDGLPNGWQANIDEMHFCADCLKRKPLDAHECRDDCAATGGRCERRC